MALSNAPSASTAAAPRDFVESAILAFLLVLAAALRLYDLGAESIWSDEAVSIRQASASITDVLRETAKDNYPPLHNLILFVFIKLFGSSEFVVRFPSALMGWLTVPVLYLLARELFDRRVALFAAALLAVSPFHILYSQEARMYSLLALCTAVSMYALVLCLNRATPWRLGLLFAATAALMYSHFYSLFVVTAQGVFLLFILMTGNGDERVRALRGSAAIAMGVLTFAPWASILVQRSTDVLAEFWLDRSDLAFLVELFTEFSGTVYMLIAFAGFAVWSVTALSRRQPSRHSDCSLVLVLAWLLVPIVVPFVVSQVVQPIIWPRYTIPALLAWYLLIAVGMGAALKSRALVAIGLVLLLAGCAAPIGSYYKSERRADSRGLARLIEDRGHAGDVVALYPYWEASLGYYWRRPDISIASSKSGVRDALNSPARGVWVVVYRDARCKRKADDLSKALCAAYATGNCRSIGFLPASRELDFGVKLRRILACRFKDTIVP